MWLIPLRNEEWRKIWKVYYQRYENHLTWQGGPRPWRQETLWSFKSIQQIQVENPSLVDTTWIWLWEPFQKGWSKHPVLYIVITHQHTCCMCLLKSPLLFIRVSPTINRQTVIQRAIAYCWLKASSALGGHGIEISVFRELYQKLRHSREETTLGHGRITLVMYCLSYWMTMVTKETSVNKYSSNWQI